jgi:transcriptional regulator with XRE-family HTH domain
MGSGLQQTLTPAMMESMGAKGLTRQQIGAFFGITGQGVGKILKKNKELDFAYECGLAQGIDKAAGKLMELIEEKNLVAIIFFLKCHAKWVEQQYVKEKEVIDIPQVRIFLPANNRDSFGETINGEIEQTAP